MVLIDKAKSLIGDVIAYWKVPATGEYVAYREYMMLSVGWLGMRLATTFGIGFSVNNAFTAMTLHMTHRDLLILGYVCMAINYLLAPLNAWIIDNLRSRAGKYRVFVRLAAPSGLLSLFALFYPYEKLSYIPMVVSLFVIGQIQGYIQGWYSTGVSNLVYVVSPNSQERVKIMTVTSLVHNFAPSITGMLIPALSDVVAGGDLYSMKNYRLVYPGFIVIGVALSLTAYYGVSERIVEPRSRATGVSLRDALREVAKNKLFWIKCSDNWNNFMEDCKNVLMQWVFYYGKAGSMTLYGVMDTLSYNSSMWAMLFSPWMISHMGKRGFKLIKNISQVFITLGIALTYKKSLWFIFIFYFLNRFWETTEVIDRAIESDIRDYQQYLSGERIDGSFGVIDTYVGGAVGAVTNLFVPWVYRRNGFDGTDYSVLNVYDDNGNYKPDNVLYPLLDELLKFSLIGAAIDIVPWFFYDLTDADQKAVVRVIRLRSAIEDRANDVPEDGLYCEACEGVLAMREHLDEPRPEKVKANGEITRKEARRLNHANKPLREEIDAAQFLHRELTRYESEFGAALADLCRTMAGAGPDTNVARCPSSVRNAIPNEIPDFEALAVSLPQAQTKEEKQLRADAVRMARMMKRTHGTAKAADVASFSPAAYEALYDLPEDTKEEQNAKRKAIRAGSKQRRAYGRVMKPCLWARRQVTLCEAYADIDGFLADYPAAKARRDEAAALQKAETDRLAAERKAEAARRRNK